MRQAELELKIKHIIKFHYGGDLWMLRPELEDDESVEAFILSLTDLMNGTKTTQAEVKEGRSPFSGNHNPDLLDERTMQLTKEIGTNLKKFRLRQKLSQAELADKAGITLDNYAKIENGEARVRFWEYEQIMNALNLKSWLALPK